MEKSLNENQLLTQKVVAFKKKIADLEGFIKECRYDYLKNSISDIKSRSCIIKALENVLYSYDSELLALKKKLENL